MTFETLKKAENIRDKIKRVDSVLKCLNSTSVYGLQKKDVVANEDLTTNLTFWVDDNNHLRENNEPFPVLHLTNDHIEIMKQAFDAYRKKLEMDFDML